MENIKSIDRKISELIKFASSKEQRKQLNSLKKAIYSYNDRLYYEANYDKRFYLCNYNKFVRDLKELDRSNFYIIFVKIPQLTLNYHIDEKANEKDTKFIDELNNQKSSFGLARNNIYKTCDFLMFLAFKSDVNDIYKKIKEIKNSNNAWKGYQMTYIKYQKYSSKISKNLSACIKQANNIFSGEKTEKNEWE